MQEIKGRRVLITGAASGIGLATAIAFARAGANLVLTDVDADRLAEAQRTVRATGVGCIAQIVDVVDEAAMARFADVVAAEAGPVDVLINNAGIAYLGSFLDTPTAVWRRVLDVNVLGVVHGCRAFLPRMIAAGGTRRVVNIASAAGFAPAVNMTAYAASKYAVMGLSEVLAMELHGTGVGVTTVCPGIINTDIVRHPGQNAASVWDEQLARLQRYYRDHGATPDVVAASIVEGVRDGRELILVGPKARSSYHLKRFSRSLLQRLTRANSKQVGFC